MDKVIIQDLRVPTLIGVHAHERTAPQILLITATLFISIQQAAKTDAISDALDYTKVRQAILEFGQAAQYELLESFISHLAASLKAQFSLTKVQLSVTKQPVDMPDISGVTLVVER